MKFWWQKLVTTATVAVSQESQKEEVLLENSLQEAKSQELEVQVPVLGMQSLQK